MPTLWQCGDCDTIREIQRTANPSMEGSMLGLPIHMVGILTVPSSHTVADKRLKVQGATCRPAPPWLTGRRGIEGRGRAAEGGRRLQWCGIT